MKFILFWVFWPWTSFINDSHYGKREKVILTIQENKLSTTVLLCFTCRKRQKHVWTVTIITEKGHQWIKAAAWASPYKYNYEGLFWSKSWPLLNMTCLPNWTVLYPICKLIPQVFVPYYTCWLSERRCGELECLPPWNSGRISQF